MGHNRLWPNSAIDLKGRVTIGRVYLGVLAQDAGGGGVVCECGDVDTQRGGDRGKAEGERERARARARAREREREREREEEREKERKRENGRRRSRYTHVHPYIYIHTHTFRDTWSFQQPWP